MKFRWRLWSKTNNTDSSEMEADNFPKKQRNASVKFNLFTGVGSVAAGLAALALGDPTGGIVIASIFGAVISLASPTKSYIEDRINRNQIDGETIIAMELQGIHHTLRSMLLMLIFGALAYGFQVGLEVLSKQFEIVNENPLPVAITILALIYFFVVRKLAE